MNAEAPASPPLTAGETKKLVRAGIKARQKNNGTEAVRMFSQAAARGGCGIAMLNLAVMHSKGEGVPNNEPDHVAAFVFAQSAVGRLQQTGPPRACERAVQALDHLEAAGMIPHPRVGTGVELTLVDNAAYQGARGTVAKVILEGGGPARAAVVLETTGKVVSVALKKVRVYAAAAAAAAAYE